MVRGLRRRRRQHGRHHEEEVADARVGGDPLGREEERELAITRAESDHALAYETSDGVASAYGIAFTTATLDDELDYLARLRTITSEQIRDAARKYLPVTAYARIAFVPAPR